MSKKIRPTNRFASTYITAHTFYSSFTRFEVSAFLLLVLIFVIIAAAQTIQLRQLISDTKLTREIISATASDGLTLYTR